jgi:hypothetical protein
MADRKPIKAASGVITEFGTGDTIALVNGGTGQTTAALAIEALLAALSATQGVIPYRGSSAWAALATGTAGQVLTSGGAGANPSWGDVSFSGLIAKAKTSDESVTSSTSLQDDDDLFFAIGANETWVFILPFGLVCGASGGFKWAFSVPASASAFGSNLAGLARLASVDLTTGSGETSSSTTASNQPFIAGYCANSSTPGNVRFRFAQNVSNGTATTVKRGSILIAAKL